MTEKISKLGLLWPTPNSNLQQIEIENGASWFQSLERLLDSNKQQTTSTISFQVDGELEAPLVQKESPSKIIMPALLQTLQNSGQLWERVRKSKGGCFIDFAVPPNHIQIFYIADNRSEIYGMAPSDSQQTNPPVWIARAHVHWNEANCDPHFDTEANEAALENSQTAAWIPLPQIEFQSDWQLSAWTLAEFLPTALFWQLIHQAGTKTDLATVALGKVASTIEGRWQPVASCFADVQFFSTGRQFLALVEHQEEFAAPSDSANPDEPAELRVAAVTTEGLARIQQILPAKWNSKSPAACAPNPRFWQAFQASATRLLGPLAGTRGLSEEELAVGELQWQVELPALLRQYYLKVGQWVSITRSYGRLLNPSEWYRIEDLLIFWEEVDRSVCWGLPLTPKPVKKANKKKKSTDGDVLTEWAEPPVLEALPLALAPPTLLAQPIVQRVLSAPEMAHRSNTHSGQRQHFPSPSGELADFLLGMLYWQAIHGGLRYRSVWELPTGLDSATAERLTADWLAHCSYHWELVPLNWHNWLVFSQGGQVVAWQQSDSPQSAKRSDLGRFFLAGRTNQDLLTIQQTLGKQDRQELRQAG